MRKRDRIDIEEFVDFPICAIFIMRWRRASSKNVKLGIFLLRAGTTTVLASAEPRSALETLDTPNGPVSRDHVYYDYNDQTASDGEEGQWLVDSEASAPRDNNTVSFEALMCPKGYCFESTVQPYEDPPVYHASSVASNHVCVPYRGDPARRRSQLNTDVAMPLLAWSLERSYYLSEDGDWFSHDGENKPLRALNDWPKATPEAISELLEWGEDFNDTMQEKPKKRERALNGTAVHAVKMAKNDTAGDIDMSSYEETVEARDSTPVAGGRPQKLKSHTQKINNSTESAAPALHESKKDS